MLKKLAFCYLVCIAVIVSCACDQVDASTTTTQQTDLYHQHLATNTHNACPTNVSTNDEQRADHSAGWASTLQQWWQNIMGGNAENTGNAKLCVKFMIHGVNAQGMHRRSSSSSKKTNGIKYRGFAGTCYCGAFFGNKLSQPKLAKNALELVIENLDELGIANTGYSAQANIGPTPEERYGIAIYCDHDGQARVTDQLTRLANPEIAGFI